MKILRAVKKMFNRSCQENPSLDEVEIVIMGQKVKMIRKMCLPVPHELSLYVPRVELTNKVTEGDKTTETSVILNSITIVSAPRNLVPGHPQGLPPKPSKAYHRARKDT